MSSRNNTYYVERFASTPRKMVQKLQLVNEEIMQHAGIRCNETLNTFLGKVLNYRMAENSQGYGK